MADYRKRKLDTNHRPVLQHILATGRVAEELFDPLDLIVWDKDGWACFVEVKRPEANTSKFTRVQLAFIVMTSAPVIVATSGEDAIAKITARQIITPRQKLAISTLLQSDNSKKMFTEKDVRGIL